MANKNLGRVCENGGTALHEMKFKVAKALELVRKYAKICVLALLVSNGAAFAESVSTKDPVLLVSTSDASPIGDEGAGIDLKGKLAAIETEIQNINQKILTLEDRDVLSRDEKKELFLLKRSLVALENQRQEYQAVIIEEGELKTKKLDEKLRKKFEEINAAARG